MDFLYCSYTDKKPFGAVSDKDIITMRFPIRYAVEAESVTLKLRKYGESGPFLSLPLAYKEADGIFNIYTCVFTLPDTGIYFYRFEVKCPDGIWFIGRGAMGRAERGDFLPEWQITVYSHAFKTPEYIKGGVIYHVFADRFNTSGTVAFNKRGILKTWDKDVTIHQPDGKYDANDFYGGDFKGITAKLDYLKSLNVSLLYLSPIFDSCSNHRYDTGDYLKLDPLMGTEEDFKRLITEAEKLGIGIMLDGVFNHAGADSLYFNKFGHYPEIGAYQSKKSKYYRWFNFEEYPEKYDCWWGITSVPTINKSNPSYRKLLLGPCGILDKWTRSGIKGWRLDVADELPEELLNKIRTKVKSIDSDVLIMGEVWEDASIKVSYGTLRPYLNGHQLDGVMNYPYRAAIIKYVTEGGAAEFAESVMSIAEHYPKATLYTMMNILSTHDTIRIINALSGLNAPTKAERQKLIVAGETLELARARLKAAAVLQYTLPGVPSVYYGDEAGLQGFEDPLNRRPFPWGKEDADLQAFYIKLGEIRKNHKEALTGTIRMIEHTDMAVFLRETKGENLMVIVNCSTEKQIWTNPEKGVNLLDRHVLEKGEIIQVLPLETLIISY